MDRALDGQPATGHRIAVFDLDGTLTRHDTMWMFFRHVSASLPDYCIRLLRAVPAMVAFAAGAVSAEGCKSRLLDIFLGGKSGDEIRKLAASFVRVIDDDLRPFASEYLSALRRSGRSLWLCSASVDIWVQPWASVHGFDKVLCSEMRFAGGRCQIVTPNCKGDEKVARIEAALPDGRKHCFIEAYGNSAADMPMLSFADAGHYKPDFGALVAGFTS